MSETDCSDQSRTILGNVLATSHEIIKKILDPLRFYDLLNAAQVCGTWSKLGCSILENEQRLHFTTICLKEEVTQESHEVRYKLDPSSEMFMKRLPNVPSYCFAIYCRDLEYSNKIVASDFPEGTTFYKYLESQLPKNCDVITIPAYGVIGTDELTDPLPVDKLLANYKQSTKDHNEVEEYPSFNFNNCGETADYEDAPYVGGNSSWICPNALSLLFFPRRHGVSIRFFTLNESSFFLTHRPNQDTKPKLLEITSTEFNKVCGLDPDDELKAFLIFTSQMKRLPKAFVSAALSRQNDQLAIGGILLEDLPGQNGQKNETIGVVVTGANVRSASIVVPFQVRNEKDLLPYFERLKGAGLPESHSVCFVFSCCGRGSHWYGRNKEVSGNEFCNIETNAFRRFFPNTPMIGLYGGGEIGNTYLTGFNSGKSEPLTSPRKKRKSSMKWTHEYSSVFVLLSFL